MNPANKSKSPWKQLKAFSWRQRIPICSPETQGNCHSCFAISAVQCLSDRYTIQHGLSKSPNLSPLYLLACYENHRKLDCDSGGYAIEVCKLLEDLGTVTRKCWPDKSVQDLGCCPESKFGSVGAVGCCADGCNIGAGRSSKNRYCKYFAKKGSSKQIRAYKQTVSSTSHSNTRRFRGSEIDIERTTDMLQKEIWLRGPVVACFRIPRKLAAFLIRNNSASESKSSNEFLWYDPPSQGETMDTGEDAHEIVGAHSACITGWKRDKEGKLYWEVRSSSKTNCGYYYLLAAQHYPKHAARIGLDVPIRIVSEGKSNSGTAVRKRPPGSYIIWGGATRLDAGPFSTASSLNKNVYRTSSILTFVSIGIMALLSLCR